MKVSVAQGNAEHYADKAKMSRFSDYKILYDITADASSGTGAHPDDGLFKHNEGLTGLLGAAKQEASGLVSAVGA